MAAEEEDSSGAELRAPGDIGVGGVGCVGGDDGVGVGCCDGGGGCRYQLCN